MNKLHCVIDTTSIGLCNVEITNEAGEKVCSVDNIWLENALSAIRDASVAKKRSEHGKTALGA